MPIVKLPFYIISSLNPVQFRSQNPKPSLNPPLVSSPGRRASKANTSTSRTNPGAESMKFHISDQLIQRIIASLDGQVRIAFEAQYVWSLRACEVLAIKNKDIQPNGLIFIPSRKGSNGRFIASPSISKLKCDDSFYADYRVFTIGYDAYYRCLKRSGLCFKLSGNSKYLTVTHSPRKFNIQNLKDNTGAKVSELMGYSGHKSISGINYYLDGNSLKNEED